MGFSTGYGEGSVWKVKTKKERKCNLCKKTIPKGATCYTRGFGRYYHIGHQHVVGKGELLRWRKKHGVK